MPVEKRADLVNACVVADAEGESDPLNRLAAPDISRKPRP